MQKQALRLGLYGIRDLRAEAKYRFHPAQAANAHAEINDYKVRELGKIDGCTLNTLAILNTPERFSKIGTFREFVESWRTPVRISL